MQAQKKSKKQPKLWVFACLLFFFCFFLHSFCFLFAFFLLCFCFLFAFFCFFLHFSCIFWAVLGFHLIFSSWLPFCVFFLCRLLFSCFFFAFFPLLFCFSFFACIFFAFFFACFFCMFFCFIFLACFFFCIIYCFSFRLAFLFTLFFFAFFPLKSKVLVSRISPVLVIISVVINLGMLNDAWWFSSQVFEKCASHCKTDRVMIADDCLILFLFGKLMGNFALWLIIFSCGQCALAMIR